MEEQVRLAGTTGVRTRLHLCTLDLAAPAPHILASRVVGMGSLELVRHVIAYGDELRANAGRIQIFHDFRGVEGYAPEARRVLVEWGVQNKDSIAATHVLFRSKLVSMGVRLATRLLQGQLEGYSDPKRFEAALARAIVEGA